MPILVADGRAPGEILISGNATNYEFNPWEMGSFDPTVYGFAPLKYTGSNFTGGKLESNQQCIEGFDNVGFVMGTSSSLFNQLILNLESTSAPEVLKNVVGSILEGLGQAQNDIADWTPNPFYHFNNRTNPNAQAKRLTLVDGGEDLQNIPLNPLIQPVRNVDVIFAVDSSADTTAENGAANWPNGTALVATYERSLNETMDNGTAFPAIPGQNTFVNLGLNTRPTFFGCDSSNLTGPAPLVVYVPNTPYVYNSNVSTFTLSYNNTERNAIIQNGYDVATMGNGTLDKDFPTCVGCAVLSRSWERTGTTVPDVCQMCFTKYCWDGTLNGTDPGEKFPASKMEQVKVSAGGKFGPSFLSAVMAVGTAVLLAF
jgi:lysophospholipase